MSLSLIYVPAFLFAITLLVGIHEYGHYIVARACGIRVLRFSIGFGRPLWSRRLGPDQTEYCLSMFPIGGYVKMLDEREGPVPPELRGRTFNAQPVLQRIAVLLAGPAFNFLFVIVAFWGLFLYGVPTQKAVVGTVEPGSFAAVADLRSGDTIETVDGADVIGWEATVLAVLEDMVDDGVIRLGVRDERGAVRAVTIDVGDSAARLTEPGALLSGIGFTPWQPTAARIGEVAPGSAAAAAGLRPGDRVTAVGGVAVNTWAEMVDQLALVNAPRAVAIRYEREGTVFDAEPVLQPTVDNGVTRHILGVTPDRSIPEGMLGTVRLGPLAAVPAAIDELIDKTGFTIRMLGRMLTGDVSIKNLSGPVSIAQFAGETAKAGADYYIRFLAIISISLGVLNLLPIPILDGGQIVYQVVEWAKGGPISERTQLIAQNVGIALLLGIMGFAFYNDFARLFSAS